jgi:hypothetical protein
MQELSRSERKLIPTGEHFFEKRLPGTLITTPEESVSALPKTKEDDSGSEEVGQGVRFRLEMALESSSEVVIGSDAWKFSRKFVLSIFMQRGFEESVSTVENSY